MGNFPSDQRLLELIKQSDRKAHNQIRSKYLRLIRFIIKRRISCHVMSDKLVNRVFYNLWLHRAGLPLSTNLMESLTKDALSEIQYYYRTVRPSQADVPGIRSLFNAGLDPFGHLILSVSQFLKYEIEALEFEVFFKNRQHENGGR